jgi:AP endonuclease 2
VDGEEVHIKEIMNPTGTFSGDNRLTEYSVKTVPLLSGKLIPEFDRRRNIKDMFFRKPSITSTTVAVSDSSLSATDNDDTGLSTASDSIPKSPLVPHSPVRAAQATKSPSPVKSTTKRPSSGGKSAGQSKRLKGGQTAAPGPPSRGQSSLMGFFKPKASLGVGPAPVDDDTNGELAAALQSSLLETNGEIPAALNGQRSVLGSNFHDSSERATAADDGESDLVHDPIVAKESWNNLFTKPAPPRCEDHDEPCKILLTKKPGINCGRSFWMCARPLGPTGAKEKGTQWRCKTFIWSSDLNGEKT